MFRSVNIKQFATVSLELIQKSHIREVSLHMNARPKF